MKSLWFLLFIVSFLLFFCCASLILRVYSHRAKHQCQQSHAHIHAIFHLAEVCGARVKIHLRTKTDT